MVCHDTLEIRTDAEVGIYDITGLLEQWVRSRPLLEGQLLVFSRHTTTALAINEFEPELLSDLKNHLRKLVPPGAPYAHNDLVKRSAPPGEPRNAHAHLMATMLHTSEVIPVIDGCLALGTWQSALFVELDGPRDRTVVLQFTGQAKN